MPPSPQVVIAHTRAWVERVVIGLNLCPFARAPHVGGRLRYVVSDARDGEALLADLVAELRHVAAADPTVVETSLLIHPQVLQDFTAYNDFLDVADAALVALALQGVLQIASFHPHYRFAGSAPGDIGNATNRSPYPMLHLLREDSVQRAVESAVDVHAIPDANVRTLRLLGAQALASILSSCEADAITSEGTRR